MRKATDTATLPSVDISSGIVSNGPLVVGEPFMFTTSSSSEIDGITVSTGVTEWFSPYSFSFNSPGNNEQVSVTVTAELASIGTGWGYNVDGMNRSQPNPHIPVDPTIPQEKAS